VRRFRAPSPAQQGCHQAVVLPIVKLRPAAHLRSNLLDDRRRRRQIGFQATPRAVGMNALSSVISCMARPTQVAGGVGA